MPATATKLFEIVQTASGVTFGPYEAATEQDARELYAQDAGYVSHAALVEVTGKDTGVIVREVR